MPRFFGVTDFYLTPYKNKSAGPERSCKRELARLRLLIVPDTSRQI